MDNYNLYLNGIASQKSQSLLQKDFLLSIKGAKDYEEVLSLLYQALGGSGGSEESIESLLSLELDKLYKFIDETINPQIKLFFMLPNDYENALNLCKIEKFNLDKNNLSDIKLQGTLNFEELKEGIFNKDFKEIKDSEIKRLVLECYKNDFDDKKLNRLFKFSKYKRLKKEFKEREFRSLINLKLDIENLKGILLYKNEKEYLENLLPCGEIEKDFLKELYKKNKNVLRDVPSYLQKLVGVIFVKDTDKKDIEFEKVSREVIKEYLLKKAGDIESLYPFLSYIYSKYYEIMNLRTIYIYKRYGQDDLILNMLI